MTFDPSSYPQGLVRPYAPLSGLLTSSNLGGFDGTLSVSANDAFLIRIDVTTPLTISQITYIGTGNNNASMLIDLGIYELNGSTYSLIQSTGSVAAGESPSGQEVYTEDLPAVAALSPHKAYFAAVAADTQGAFTSALAVSDQFGLAMSIFGKKAASFPLPATITGPLTASRVLPWLYLA